MRNKKREKIINIVFIIYMLIRFIIKLFSQSTKFTNSIPINVSIVIITLIGTILENFYVIAIFIVIKIMRKKEYKNQLSKIDYKNEGTYYRDILNGYSPFILSYIDNFIFEGKRDIIATVLNLKLKQVIKIENNTIIKLNKDINLEESERYILDNVSDGKIKITNIKELEQKIVTDAQNKELIEIKESSKVFNKKTLKNKYMIFFLISTIIFMILSGILSLVNNVFLTIMLILGTIIFCNPIFYIILYIIKYYSYKSKIRRTNKGEEINIKLEGLKNYIQEYSKLEDKNTKDMLLWEEYLIYSVIFNINDNVIKEMDGLFN